MLFKSNLCKTNGVVGSTRMLKSLRGVIYYFLLLLKDFWQAIDDIITPKSI